MEHGGVTAETLSIAQTFAATFLECATAAGISPEVLHRVAAVGGGGLDSLPHNGAVITLLGVCGLTHKESYLNIGMLTVVLPTIACIAIIILGSFGVC